MFFEFQPIRSLMRLLWISSVPPAIGSFRPLIVEMGPIEAQFSDVLLMGRQHSNRERAPLAIALSLRRRRISSLSVASG